MTEETNEAAEDIVTEPYFSNLDFFILSLLAGVAIYWYIFKSKKKEQPTFKRLTVAPMTNKSNDSSFITKMKSSGRNVVVFYGSQTGTAEEFGGRLAKDAVNYGMKGMVADPEECDIDDLPKLAEIENSLAVFCMATYGEGDPTDNAQEFNEWLQNAEGTSLNGVRFAVFGLGNKTYEHYNAMGKYVDKRLEELGAERVFELGLGDDDGNIEEDFITWREKFWPAVCEFYGVQAVGDQISIRQYTLTVHDDLPGEKVYNGEITRLGSFKNQRPPFDAKNPYLAPVKVNRELHKGGDRSCMHIEFDISGSKIRYEAGDHVAVYPVNDPEIVNGIGKCLNVDLDQVFTLTNIDEEASKKHPFPCPCTYRTALSHYLDVNSSPRTHILREISEWADEKDKEFLLKLTSTTPEGKSLYNEWIIKDRRNILAVLEDLPSLKPPIDHICELLPRLQARYYSISSSPKEYPESVHITAVLVNYQTRTGRTMKGVATNWLALKKPENGDKQTVPIYVRKSQFRLPYKTNTPIIMIGPGTGLAPFRGFLQERHFVKKEGKPVGDTVLYYGCRCKAEDYLYEEELDGYVKDGTLTHLHLAFSRDQEEKVYVQHLLMKNKEETWKILENGGHIYICGDARNMARDVHTTLESILMECGSMNKEKAADYVKKMQNKGRYSCDVWS
ncbi:hypothetical protein ACJMK2_013069 [Sinanodonta woodiana]|uniref:NADPH--cytochrome P450 reductase n=1 Tax=Sinanodonta woodiana TaxID=1069815 RepID=A0ABD3VAD0_SINWO